MLGIKPPSKKTTTKDGKSTDPLADSGFRRRLLEFGPEPEETDCLG